MTRALFFLFVALVPGVIGADALFPLTLSGLSAGSNLTCSWPVNTTVLPGPTAVNITIYALLPVDATHADPRHLLLSRGFSFSDAGLGCVFQLPWYLSRADFAGKDGQGNAAIAHGWPVFPRFDAVQDWKISVVVSVATGKDRVEWTVGGVVKGWKVEAQWDPLWDTYGIVSRGSMNISYNVSGLPEGVDGVALLWRSEILRVETADETNFGLPRGYASRSGGTAVAAAGLLDGSARGFPVNTPPVALPIRVRSRVGPAVNGTIELPDVPLGGDFCLLLAFPSLSPAVRGSCKRGIIWGSANISSSTPVIARGAQALSPLVTGPAEPAASPKEHRSLSAASDRILGSSFLDVSVDRSTVPNWKALTFIAGIQSTAPKASVMLWVREGPVAAFTDMSMMSDPRFYQSSVVPQERTPMFLWALSCCTEPRLAFLDADRLPYARVSASAPMFNGTDGLRGPARFFVAMYPWGFSPFQLVDPPLDQRAELTLAVGVGSDATASIIVANCIFWPLMVGLTLALRRSEELAFHLSRARERVVSAVHRAARAVPLPSSDPDLEGAGGLSDLRARLEAADEAEGDTCRICRDPDVGGKLISPCDCSGTMRVVHEECLNRWRHTDASRLERCCVCHSPYRIALSPREKAVLFVRGLPPGAQVTALCVLIYFAVLAAGYYYKVCVYFAFCDRAIWSWKPDIAHHVIGLFAALVGRMHYTLSRIIVPRGHWTRRALLVSALTIPGSLIINYCLGGIMVLIFGLQWSWDTAAKTHILFVIGGQVFFSAAIIAAHSCSICYSTALEHFERARRGGGGGGGGARDGEVPLDDGIEMPPLPPRRPGADVERGEAGRDEGAEAEQGAPEIDGEERERRRRRQQDEENEVWDGMR